MMTLVEVSCVFLLLKIFVINSNKTTERNLKIQSSSRKYFCTANHLNMDLCPKIKLPEAVQDFYHHLSSPHSRRSYNLSFWKVALKNIFLKASWSNYVIIMEVSQERMKGISYNKISASNNRSPEKILIGIELDTKQQQWVSERGQLLQSVCEQHGSREESGLLLSPGLWSTIFRGTDSYRVQSKSQANSPR